ncbi:8-oxo-dGTP diphosphatase [Halosimplex salinum]|uniref:8-oxo-dGTP diphosphatase n=1 Tax=Halosimplex salinum TaxID=1710538 RepID=UPI000F48F3BB|nr:8-oxo-dGTP diphosphatase [Halosimplex salinum]
MDATEATLCHPIVDGELLLIRKQRGLGAGKLVGPGGKVEADETVREAARREVREELRVEPTGVVKRGEFDFHFRDREAERSEASAGASGDEGPASGEVDSDSMHVHVFAADGIEGEPEATEEAVPEWWAVDEVPYDEMWVDDRVWLPHLVDGETFVGEFVLSDDGESLVRYEMTVGVEFE